MKWDQLRQHLRTHYVMREIHPLAIEVTYNIGETRRQRTYITFSDDAHGAEYAQIDSIVGVLGEVDLDRALRLAGRVACGGLCHLPFEDRDCLSLRHSIRLESLVLEEFDLAVRIVTSAADAHEFQLTGTDMF